MKHFYPSIDGWFNFRKPYEDAVKAASDGAVFVEVGCWKGKSASFMGVEIINSAKKIDFYCVDHWAGTRGEHDNEPRLSEIEAIFKSNMDQITGLKYKMLKSDSAAAAQKFGDGTVDFVWIDAGHDYESVIKDINAWLPKVKSGGVIGGDDYPMDGVKKAVIESFSAFEEGSENGWKWWRVRKDK